MPVEDIVGKALKSDMASGYQPRLKCGEVKVCLESLGTSRNYWKLGMLGGVGYGR